MIRAALRFTSRSADLLCETARSREDMILCDYRPDTEFHLALLVYSEVDQPREILSLGKETEQSIVLICSLLIFSSWRTNV